VPRLGILGGTFNPPHRGHVAVARAARDQLGLDRVVLMPAFASPFKSGVRDPGPEDRLAMTVLACRDEDRIGACALEIERRGVSFTVDTLRSIRASHPDAELTFILGADTAATLPSWREPRELLDLAGLAVAARSGADREQVVAAVGVLGGDPADVTFLRMPAIDVSASMVRERVAAGQPVADLVGPAVAGYIADHRLYRDGGAAA
jgi:nicotinate-nucleotide adenylyltransferase